MADSFVQPDDKLSWRFPGIFWIANGAELFERAAFYGMFIALSLYLTTVVGFGDVGAGYVAAAFSSVLYLLPTFTGAMADRTGFRNALILAFTLLTVGYLLLGAAPLIGGAIGIKTVALIALGLIMFGGAIIKPVISGTVAKSSDERHRARAFSIFYQVVNIGAFLGKTVAAPVRQSLGVEYIMYYASCMAFLGLVLILVLYRNPDTRREARTIDEALAGFWKVLTNFRFMALILIVAGFWAIQGQLYASMPKYVLRLLGEGHKPEWLANINPFVVVLLVVPITHLIRNFKPVSAIGIGLFIIPFTALAIALSPVVERAWGSSISVLGFGMHLITLMVVIGIGMQGLAECFLSPKFLEYASKQAPEGEVGLYMGYQHLTNFFAWGFGFAASGHLLERFCPDPETLTSEAHAQWQAAIDTGSAMPEAYAHAHYIWYFFAGVGVAAFLALLVFKFVTNYLDRGKAV